MDIKKVELIKEYLKEKEKLIELRALVEEQIGCSILDELKDSTRKLQLGDIYKVVDATDKVETKTVSDYFSKCTKVSAMIDGITIYHTM